VCVFVNTTGVCGNKVHVPIRDSKLTHLLRDDLMGGAEMCLIASLCGLKEQAEETYSTLNFALRAMRVQTTSPILTTLVTRAAAAELVPAETPAEMIQQMATVNQKLYQENQELKAALWERDRALDSEREERESEERQRGRDIQERQREGESFNRNGNSSTRHTEGIERAWGERESWGGKRGGGGGRGEGAEHLHDRYTKSRGSTPDVETSRRHSYQTGSNLSPRVSPGDVRAFRRSGFMEEPGSTNELGGYRKKEGGRGGGGGGGGGGGVPSYSREGATWDLHEMNRGESDYKDGGLDSPETSSLPMALSVLETKERPPLKLDPNGYAESPGMRETQGWQREIQREGQTDENLHSRSLVVNERWEEKEKILVLKFTHIIGKMQQEIARLHSSKEIVLQDSPVQHRGGRGVNSHSIGVRAGCDVETSEDRAG
jgi:hypothetical protein